MLSNSVQMCLHAELSCRTFVESYRDARRGHGAHCALVCSQSHVDDVGSSCFCDRPHSAAQPIVAVSAKNNVASLCFASISGLW